MMTDPIKTSTSDIIIFPSYFLVNRMNPHSQRLDHDNKNLSFYNKRNNPYYKGLLPYINIKKLTKLKLKTNLISAAVNEFFPQLENKKFLKIHEEPKKDADYDSLEKKNSKLVNFKSLLPKQLKGNFNELNNNILTVKTMKLNYQEDSNYEAKKLNQEKNKMNVGLTNSNHLLGSNKNSSFKYYIGLGNNGELVKRVLSETRGLFWRESGKSKGVIHFRWEQGNRDFNYERLNANALYKQMVNHFEFHSEISTKSGLVKNLRPYCEEKEVYLYDITPLSFFIDFDDENSEVKIQQFLSFFYKNMPNAMKPNVKIKTTLSLSKSKNDFKIIPNIEGNLSKSNAFSKATMMDTLSTEINYLWLLKPNGLNRGRGIKIFNQIEELECHLQEIFDNERKFYEINRNKRKNNNIIMASDKILNLMKNYVDPAASSPKKPKNTNNTFVLQKYIEKPLLINKRKFDIRVWALVTHNLDAYYFSEGYIRTSSEIFDISPKTKDDYYMHLTNNAVQKNSENYGKFESGNQLSFSQLEDELKKEKDISLDFKNVMIPRMKEIIFFSLSSVKKKLNKKDRKFSFEIFGYDFIIDENLKLWLIEVNTNPCIETSSPLLEMYLPRMLDDAFKLTLDVLFPGSKTDPEKLNFNENLEKSIELNSNEKLGEKTDIETTKLETKNLLGTKIYKVDGYSDSENMWQYLDSLKS